MAFVTTEPSGRKNHGDIPLKIEEISENGRSATGVNLITGEEMEITLAEPEEIAKYFSTRNDSRPFDERLKSAENRIARRPDITINGKVEEGSVVRFENVRSYPAEGGIKNVAMWPEALARNPEKETAIVATADARLKQNGKPFITVFDEDAAMPLDRADFDVLFNGDFKGVPMATSGATIAARDENGVTLVSSVTTQFRSYADPSVDSALDQQGGLTKYDLLAAAVIAAKTGREFDGLSVSDRVFDADITNARAVFDDVKNETGKFEIMVVPTATVQFIPTHAEPGFLKEYHGTDDGKPDPNTTPNPAVSYKDKGPTPSLLSISLNTNDPNDAASLRSIQPVNGYQFKQQPDRSVPALMEEVMAERFVASAGAAQPQRQQERNLAADPSPMG